MGYKTQYIVTDELPDVEAYNVKEIHRGLIPYLLQYADLVGIKVELEQELQDLMDEIKVVPSDPDRPISYIVKSDGKWFLALVM